MSRAIAMAVQEPVTHNYEIVLEDPQQAVAKSLLLTLRKYASRINRGENRSPTSFLRDEGGSHRIRGVRISNIGVRVQDITEFLGDKFAGIRYRINAVEARTLEEELRERDGVIEDLTNVVEGQVARIEALAREKEKLEGRVVTAEDFAREVEDILDSGSKLESAATEMLAAISAVTGNDASADLLKDEARLEAHLAGFLDKVRKGEEGHEGEKEEIRGEVRSRDVRIESLERSLREDHVPRNQYDLLGIEKAALAARLDRTVAEVERLRMDLHNRGIDLHHARTELGRYRSVFGEWGRQTRGAQEKLRRHDNLIVEVVRKQDRINELDGQLREARERIEELRREADTKGREYGGLRDENAQLRERLATRTGLEDLTAEDILVEAFKRIYSTELDRAIALYNEKFEAGIPDNIRIAVMSPQELIFERYGKELLDVSIDSTAEGVNPESLAERLNSCLVEFDETEYARENLDIYRIAKLAERTYRVKKEKDLTEDERRAKEIVDGFESARVEHYRVRDSAERLIPQIRDTAEEHKRIIAETEEFRGERLPFRATFGCFAYSLGNGETTTLRFLVPTDESNYTEQAAVEFVMALASSLRGRQAEVRTGLLRNCHYIDLVYSTDISDRVDRIVDRTRESIQKLTLARIGANINIKYVGGINNGNN